MPVDPGVYRRAVSDKEQQLQAVMEMSHAGIFMTDSNRWTISFANRRMAELFGCGVDELKAKAFIDFIHPAEAELVKINMHMMVTGEIERLDCEQRFLRSDGEDFWGNFSVRRLARNDGSLQGMLFTIYDATERRETEKAINRIESNYWEIFNSTNDALFVHDAYTGAIVDANKTVEKMYGYSREEIFFMNVHDFSAGEPPYSLNEAVSLIRKAVEEGPQTCEWLGRKKNGELFWTEVTLTASHIGGEGRVLAVVRDIGDRKEIEKRLQYLSAHDSLTGLYNRLHFETIFECISRGRRYPVSIIVADLDGLKAVNDTYGHAAGDRLIKAAADLLTGAFRPDDLVARFGGDEFIVLMPETDENGAEVVMDRIRAAECRLRDTGKSPQVRFSLGSATAHAPDEIASLFHQADMRMYEDKAARKLYGADMGGCASVLQRIQREERDLPPIEA